MKAWVRLGVAVLLLGLSLAVTPSAYGADPPPSPIYTIRTVFGPPGSTPRTTTTTGIAGVPATVDVDGNLTPDLVVDLAAAGLQPSVLALATVDRVSVLPSALPVQVAMTVSFIENGQAKEAVFGYDTRDSTAPRVFAVTVKKGIGSDDTAVDFRTVGAGGALKVEAQTFTFLGGRKPEITGSVRYSPVPGQGHYEVARATSVVDSRTVETLRFTATQDVPTVATLEAGIIKAGVDKRITGTLNRLPSSAQVVVERHPTTGALLAADYSAAAPIASLNLTVNDRDSISGALLRQLVANLTGIPDRVRVENNAGVMELELAPGASIREATIGIAQGRAVETLKDPLGGGFFRSVNDGTTESKAVRLIGVSRVVARAGDPLSIELRHASPSFRALATEGSRTVDVNVTSPPSIITVTFSKQQRTLSYSANTPTPVLEAKVTDPEGVSGRANFLHLRAEAIPTRLDLAFAASPQPLSTRIREEEIDEPIEGDGGTGSYTPPSSGEGGGGGGGTVELPKRTSVHVKAPADPIGMVQVKMASSEAVKATTDTLFESSRTSDGVLTEELFSTYLVIGRVHRLRELEVDLFRTKRTKLASLFLDTDSDKLLNISLNREKQLNTPLEYLKVASRMVPEMDIDFFDDVLDPVDDGSGAPKRPRHTTLDYSARSPVPFALHTNFGDRKELRFTTSAIPTDVRVCLALSHGRCNSSPLEQSAAAEFHSSSPFAATFFDCQKSDGECNFAQADQFVAANIHSLQDLSLHVGSQEEGDTTIRHAFIDSVKKPVDVFVKLQGVLRPILDPVQIDLNAGTSADRKFLFLTGLSPSESGTLHCGANSSAILGGISLPIGILCDN